MSNLFGMVTCEQASAGLSAIGCPTHHSNAVPVENLDGERVATLCPDCDRQLPADWKTAEERIEALEREHQETHHRGTGRHVLLDCRLCRQELGGRA